MRAIIRNMADMSDSREMMEARTSPAITAFIAILLILIVAALSWSFIGEIDEVAKAPGVVRPNEKVSTIQTSSLGQIDKVFVQEGMQVESGMKLISLEQQELQIELDNRIAELDKLELEFDMLQRYKQSIETSENLFTAENTDEAYYYDLVEHFQLEYRQKELEYRSASQQMSTAKSEVIQSQDSIELSIRSSQQKVEQEKKTLNRNMKLLTADFEQEKKLKLSMQSYTATSSSLRS
ncbi:HlyD family secretion protein [Paenibacillus alkaliterrae]|uniref:HlyD family secretion protein n=1 Tax=Paenibacillus alkaliterrae TaxID=320909 RepID=UPI001F41F680|nr:HlyD family secretion protein [Paenibacillus alkaliterrae]MCF2938151.1 HlyD family secretion protein [Paenibacillus alkaliterrae]